MDSSTFVGLGSVTVPYEFTGTSATLNARLFDAAPDGTELLITRGTYRLETPGPGPGSPGRGARAAFLRQPLALRPGHRIRLDLTQIDFPTYHPSNLSSTISFEKGVTLTLPTREAGSRTLGG